MTEKLFYEDSHMITFSAVVEACEKVGDYYEAVLSRTAFFPEGGGQYADTGKIDGVKVIDVQERNDVIYHTIEEPIPVGKKVEGQLDWEERLSKMQQHSGEHIVSGIVHEMYGYDNTGFHMGKEAITMDFNGLITKEQLKEIEQKANRVIAANVEIQTSFPTKEELCNIEYRSKMEIEGQVRLVTIAGCDCCACCAPHVKRTGEIGGLKLLNVQNYKGGVRVSMLCGFRALEDYDKKSDILKELSNMLSAPETEIIAEIVRLKEEITTQKWKIEELQFQALQQKVECINVAEQMVLLFEEKLEGNAPRELVNLLLEKNVQVGAVFTGNSLDGYRYVIGSRQEDTRPFAKRINEMFQGRGGGKPEMVQGTIRALEVEIREAMETCRKEFLSADIG